MLFYYFFNDYKNAYKVKFKNHSIKGKILIFVFIFIFLLCIAFLVATIYYDKLLLSFAIIIIIFVVGIITDRIHRKKLDIYWKNHKNKKINKLIALLKSDKYKLYNEIGIDMLMLLCKERIDKHPIKMFFSRLGRVVVFAIIPVFILYLGGVFRNIENRVFESFTIQVYESIESDNSIFYEIGITELNNSISDNFIFSFTIIFLILFSYLMIEMLLSSITPWEKHKVLYEDLGYVKTQLKNKTLLLLPPSYQ